MTAVVAEVTPREWFESWREPGDFYARAQETVSAIPLSKWLKKYVRDAYVAGVFARIWRDAQGPCSVRLVPEREQFPDAQLRIGGAPMDLEIALADREGRRMWEEHKLWGEMAARGEYPKNEPPDVRRANAIAAIPRVCAQKAAKHYAGQRPTHLLISIAGGQLLMAPEMTRLTEKWRGDFESIYLLCGMDVFMAQPTPRLLRGVEPF